MALSLDEALGMSLADEVDESIHVNVNTRQITIPESQQLFGVESDADVEVKHIIIDGRYANGNRDLSKLAWRVIYRNANKETSYYLIPSVVANENSIEMDWLIKRSVVAYKGTVDFILCAFATTSSGEVTPEWNSTLGQGIVLEGLETSAIDIGKESVDELSKILYETITARDAAANSAADADNTANSIKDSMTQIAANKEAVSQLKEKLDTVKQQVANITPDDSTIGEKPWSSKNIVDMLCPPLEESGNPVVCYPVAGYPLGIKAKWEPVQEGSGTPYPAGGGKNLWGDLIQNTFISQQGLSSGYPGTKTTGKIPCAEGDKYTLSSVNAFASRPGNIGVIAFFDANDLMLSRVANTYQKAFTVTAPANTAYVRASCYAETNADKVQLEKGSTATEYAPYENIRPIKGRDSVMVERCGENLLKNKGNQTIKGITWSFDDEGFLTINGSIRDDISDYFFFGSTIDNPEAFTAIEDMILSSNYITNNGNNIFGVRTNNGMLGNLGKKEKILIPSGTKVYGVFMRVLNATVDYSGIYAQLEFGSIQTAYKPYRGDTLALTLPSTIYGGEVDAVSGEGIKNWERLVFDGTEAWKYDTRGFFTYSLPQKAKSAAELLCDRYTGKYVSTAEALYVENKIFVVGTSVCGHTTVSEWNAYLAAQYAAGTPVQICYQLAEPVPFTATGAQPIPALAGVNTMLTDADSVTVTGGADPIKRITDLETSIASMT